MIVLILLCCATSYVLFAWMVFRRRVLSATTNMPHLSGQLPLLGIACRVIGDNKHLWDTIQEVCSETNDKGGVVKTWLGPTGFCIAVTDPEISIGLANNCLDKPYLYHWAENWLGDGLVTANADIWKTHRKMLNPAFNQSVLNSFLQVFNQQSGRLVKKLSEYGHQEFNHRACIAKNALETICQTAMGLPENNIDIVDNIYLNALDKLLESYFHRICSLWKHPQSIYNVTSMKREDESFVKILQGVSSNVLKKSKESILNETSNNDMENKVLGGRFKPFLKLLLEESQNGQLSDKEIRDEVDTIIAAGYETTANTLVTTLIMIGSHTEVQEKIFKELQETFGDTNRDVTKADMAKLVYLDAVVKECLRLHPVVPVIARTVTKNDVKCGDYTFPEGSLIFLLLCGINRHPCWGDNRNEFVPDRWLSPQTLPSNPHAFAAFSIGKRTCLGKTYAMMSVKVTLAHILRTYRVRADHTKLDFNIEFVLKPVAGNQISLELR